MAIIIESKGKFNKSEEKSLSYRVSCPKCGLTFTYQGVDIAYHRRFLEGYIYCPKCRMPISHNQDNAILEKDYYLNNYRHYKPETLSNMKIQLIVFRIIMPILIVCGVVLMILGTIPGLLPEVVFGEPSKNVLWIFFFSGLTLTISSAVVFGTLIKNRKLAIEEHKMREICLKKCN